ncbi:MAG: hypothetical protein KDB65_00660 [Calditrichaeota bacterium]|nr:hypothetical protein [Calditrichota bacterium]MCB9369273.1 hypothetical protein [Calditrichota bacterium]
MFRRLLILSLLIPISAFAYVEEFGSLTGFLMDTCSNCAYDNWQAHVSERIVRPGYNDYGPETLDPQTDGFGGFEYIPENPEGDATLANWTIVFGAAINGQWNIVDSVLTANDNRWNYELVQFSEPETQRTYYIIRERLDSSFVDVNGDTLPENDVIGGFTKGWGVFVFSDQPRYSKTALQLPHPEDDFMSIPVGIQMFQEVGMEILEIAGAGREVMWDSTQHEYNNARTLSDPSRNARHPFAVLSKVVTDAWNAPPVNPFVIIQLHSYDHASHLQLPDIQVSCFADDAYPNPPVRDLAYHRDLFHAFPVYPVTGLASDQNVWSVIDNYIGLWGAQPYTYYGEDTTITIRNVNDLPGAPGNVEADYCHDGQSVSYDTENFIHIELDEYPDELWRPLDWVRWLPDAPPTHWGTYINALEFYAPFISAIDSMLAWREVPDTTPPVTCMMNKVYDFGNGTVEVQWEPNALDRHFNTYEIYYDTLNVSLSSPHVSRSTNGFQGLGNMFLSSRTLEDLPAPVWRYHFAIRAKDMAGNVTPLSPALSITEGYVSDLAVTVDGDSLRLFWNASPSDSAFEVREYPPDTGGYYIIGITDTNTFAFEPSVYSYLGPCILEIKRIIRP